MALRPKLFYRTRFKNQELAERAQVAFRRGDTSAVGSWASFFSNCPLKSWAHQWKTLLLRSPVLMLTRERQLIPTIQTFPSFQVFWYLSPLTEPVIIDPLPGSPPKGSPVLPVGSRARGYDQVHFHLSSRSWLLRHRRKGPVLHQLPWSHWD